MQPLNYHHLYYFFVTAREGSIASAAKVLCVTPQTVSGQLSKFEHNLGFSLFERKNKKLIPNSKGRLAFQYAEDIFNKGQNLIEALRMENQGHLHQLNIGVTDAIPKVLTFDVIQSAMKNFSKTRFVFKEGDFETLHDAMAHNKIDFILSDRPSNIESSFRLQSQYLGETGISFFAKKNIEELSRTFPHSLHQQPFLISGDKSHLKNVLETWFIRHQLTPSTLAEFEDTALLKLMGGQGLGIFTAPSIIEQDVERQYGVRSIGRTDEIKEGYYAIMREGQQHKPIIQHILNTAQTLFKGLGTSVVIAGNP